MYQYVYRYSWCHQKGYPFGLVLNLRVGVYPSACCACRARVFCSLSCFFLVSREWSLVPSTATLDPCYDRTTFLEASVARNGRLTYVTDHLGYAQFLHSPIMRWVHLFFARIISATSRFCLALAFSSSLVSDCWFRRQQRSLPVTIVQFFSRPA